MASKELIAIRRQADNLSPDEQLELISYLAQHLAQQAQLAHWEPRPRPKWSDLLGTARFPLTGEEDAQEWVTRTRREADEHREQALRTTEIEKSQVPPEQDL